MLKVFMVRLGAFVGLCDEISKCESRTEACSSGAETGSLPQQFDQVLAGSSEPPALVVERRPAILFARARQLFHGLGRGIGSFHR
jgi:hypothetical protein